MSSRSIIHVVAIAFFVLVCFRGCVCVCVKVRANSSETGVGEWSDPILFLQGKYTFA